MPDQDDLSAASAFSAARDAATPGPWRVEPHYAPCFTSSGEQANGFRVPEVDTCGDCECAAMSQADAEFIALARNSDLPERIERMVAENERLEAIVARIRKAVAVEIRAMGTRGWSADDAFGRLLDVSHTESQEQPQ